MSSHADTESGSHRLFESSRCEWIWVLVVSGLVLLLSSIPYLVAYWAQTPDTVFNGAVFDRADYAVHLATMQLGARGDWAYRFLFTHEPHAGAYVKSGYIALGHLAALMRLSLPVAYQFARLVFGLTASLMIYLLMVMIFKGIYWRRIGFLLALLGSGLGWLLMLLGWYPSVDISPIDFWLVDGYVFFSILTFPHFSAVITLITGMVIAYLGYLKRESLWLISCMILMGICAQTIQPYAPVLADLAILGAFLGASWQDRRLQWKGLVVLSFLGISQLPLWIYNAQIFKSGPIWQEFVAQNITLSPPSSYYFWGYFLFWPLVIIGLGKLLILLKARGGGSLVDNVPGLTAMAVWASGALVLAYLPSVLQRRFMLGFTVPLSVLATFALKSMVFPWLEQHKAGWFDKRKGYVPVLLIIFSMISSLLLSINTAWFAAQRPRALFDPEALVGAVDWLAGQANPGDVVLSSEGTGQLVASRTGLRVFIGHPIETMDYRNKLMEMQDFYQGKISPDRMYHYGVDWVIWGPDEKAVSGRDQPGFDLSQAYKDQDVVIYRIQP